MEPCQHKGGDGSTWALAGAGPACRVPQTLLGTMTSPHLLQFWALCLRAALAASHPQKCSLRDWDVAVLTQREGLEERGRNSARGQVSSAFQAWARQQTACAVANLLSISICYPQSAGSSVRQRVVRAGLSSSGPWARAWWPRGERSSSLDLLANGHTDRSDARASEHRRGSWGGGPSKGAPGWAGGREAAVLCRGDASVWPKCFLGWGSSPGLAQQPWCCYQHHSLAALWLASFCFAHPRYLLQKACGAAWVFRRDSCAAYCRWPCFGRGVGLDDPQRSLPTPTILWFCDSVAAGWSDDSRAGQGGPLLAIVISTLAPHRSFSGLAVTVALRCCVRRRRRHQPLPARLILTGAPEATQWRAEWFTRPESLFLLPRHQGSLGRQDCCTPSEVSRRGAGRRWIQPPSVGNVRLPTSWCRVSSLEA